MYRDVSVGNLVRVAVTSMEALDKQFGPSVPATKAVSAAQVLKSFCSWQRGPGRPRPDVALLLTRANICR